MKPHYECELETEGYRLKVTVFSESVSSAEQVARQRAAQLFKEMHGVERNEAMFKVLAIREKGAF